MLLVPWVSPIPEGIDNTGLRTPEGGSVGAVLEAGSRTRPLSRSGSRPSHVQGVLSLSQGPQSLILVERQFIRTDKAP